MKPKKENRAKKGTKPTQKEKQKKGKKRADTATKEQRRGRETRRHEQIQIK